MAMVYNAADSDMQTRSGFGKEGIKMFKRSGIWWTCIRHNGRRIQKSLETTAGEKECSKSLQDLS